jgi:hypothetical protein
MDKKITLNLGDLMNQAEAFDTANNLVMKVDFFGEEMWIVRKNDREKVGKKEDNGQG